MGNIIDLTAEIIHNTLGILLTAIPGEDHYGCFHMSTRWDRDNRSKVHMTLVRIKQFLPIDVLRKLYFSMVQSQLQYGILAWVVYHSRLNELQKRIIRIITQSKYKSHCDSLFKVLELLKIEDLYELNCLKFLYNFKKGLLPKYFMFFRCTPRSPSMIIIPDMPPK